MASKGGNLTQPADGDKSLRGVLARLAVAVGEPVPHTTGGRMC